MAKSKKMQHITEEDYNFLDAVEGVALNTLRVGASFIHKGRKYNISTIAECPKDWRSHLHINKSDCFDGRTLVKTV